MKYIDADAFKGRLKRAEASTFALEELNLLIDITPSADVAPVRHGWWNADRSYIGWVCSECCYAISDRHLKQNYCPNCGARMDGESDDE